ncbi:hypothetical protein VNO80_15961 [Phaseolus coccineus]|uniref:Uncharacterized protein n=1 Tax=Phaseolus coccineus TaxID=3886 RepID=A0AAN9ML77_PHACN
MSLAPKRCPHASRHGDVRMPLAPWRCPHASRALAMPACLSRPSDARMPRALAIDQVGSSSGVQAEHEEEEHVAAKGVGVDAQEDELAANFDQCLDERLEAELEK